MTSSTPPALPTQWQEPYSGRTARAPRPGHPCATAAAARQRETDAHRCRPPPGQRLEDLRDAALSAATWCAHRSEREVAWDTTRATAATTACPLPRRE